MLKFLKSVEKTAKNVNDAINAALLELGVSADDATIEVLDEGTKGFLGIGAKDARVLATINDTNAAHAKQFLNKVFDAMELPVDISAKTTDNILNINLEGDDMGIIIGKRGDTLDSIQYLTSLVVNQESEEYVKVTVDTENYREKRTQSLIQLSNRLADKVIKSGRKYTLEPMNPYERRVIHSNLQSNDSITTYSIGEDPYRKIVIALKNPKPYNKKPSYSNSGSDFKRGGYGSSSGDFKKGGYSNNYNTRPSPRPRPTNPKKYDSIDAVTAPYEPVEE